MKGLDPKGLGAEDGFGITPDLEPGYREEVRLRLLAWEAQNGRDLPWRREADPYRVLVSEFMLVQTTVTAVKPYYARFLDRFPDVATLAAADEAEVLRLWEGLGYYRRARQLHSAARAIVAEHDGCVPSQLEALEALPGIGPYMAGAVRSLAFNLPAPILEANTQRLLARLLAWDRPLSESASRRRLWDAATRLVDPASPGRFNQGLMDLGATLCTPRQPRCLACPLRSLCRAHLQGRQDAIPLKAPRTEMREGSEACVILDRGDKVLLVRRATGQLWQGFWEFPTWHISGADPAHRDLGASTSPLEAIRLFTGLEVGLSEVVHRVKYTVTCHKMSLAIHFGHSQKGRIKPGPGLDAIAWLTPSELAAHPLPATHRRLARWWQAQREARP